MGTQQHHSLTRRLCLLPHLEEQPGAGLVSLAAVRDAAGMEGLIWGPTCVPLIWLPCPCVQLLGVPPIRLCAQAPLETPAPPNPHGHAQVLPPSLANTHSHQCWNMVPKAPCCPLGLSWAVAAECEVGSREGLGASLGALCIRADPLGTDTRHPPSPGATQGPAGPCLGFPGKPPQPPGSPQLWFCRVVSGWNSQGCHAVSRARGRSHPPAQRGAAGIRCHSLCCHHSRSLRPCPRAVTAVTRWVTMRSFY